MNHFIGISYTYSLILSAAHLKSFPSTLMVSWSWHRNCSHIVVPVTQSASFSGGKLIILCFQPVKDSWICKAAWKAVIPEPCYLLTLKLEEEILCWSMRWRTNGSVHVATGWTRHWSGVPTAAKTNLPISTEAGDGKRRLWGFKVFHPD